MLRIPNSAFGGAAPADMKVWMAAATCNFLGTGPVFCSNQGNWPDAGMVAETATNEYSAPAMTDWAQLRRTTSCPAQVMITSAGVQNSTGTTPAYDPAKPFTWPQRIHLDSDGDPSNDPANFFAGRLNTPVATTAGSYKARFFIADWGSQIGNLAIAQWTEIGLPVDNPGAAAGATEHMVMRFPPAGMSAAEHKKLACKYSKCTSAVAGCPYPSDTKPTECTGPDDRKHHPHQCTMIRLEASGAASGVQFSRDSRIFNTNFVGASTYTREATISTVGIDTVVPAPAPAPPAGRDIYIYVRPSNMPETTAETPTEETVSRLERIAAATGRAPPGRRPRPEVKHARDLRTDLGPRSRRPGGAPRGKQQKMIARLRTLPLDTVRMVAPTLEFFVYYDTGRTLSTFDGKTSKWLAPMTSFGYVVEHVGSVEGWAWALDGADHIGGNWYRVRIKDGHERDVRTRVQAVEGRRMPPGSPRWPAGRDSVGEPGRGNGR
jgi:hypothetical protein